MLKNKLHVTTKVHFSTTLIGKIQMEITRTNLIQKRQNQEIIYF